MTSFALLLHRHISNVILCLASTFFTCLWQISFFTVSFSFVDSFIFLARLAPSVSLKIQRACWLLDVAALHWSVWCWITLLLPCCADTGCDIEDLLYQLKGNPAFASYTNKSIQDEIRFQGHISLHFFHIFSLYMKKSCILLILKDPFKDWNSVFE